MLFLIRSTHKNAFTLIELLVVIAIIALLAAILFPVFARARENARRSSCQSNLKQVGIGILQYTQDYDEKYPMYSVSGGKGTPGSPYGWADAIQPYIKSEQLYQCPSDVTPPPTDDPTYTKPQNVGYCDYVYNVAIGSQPQNTGTAATGSGAALAQIQSPTLCMMVMDGKKAPNANTALSDTSNNGSARMATRGSGGESLAGANNLNTALHLSGCNLLFVDGHVKWCSGKAGATTTLANVWNANTAFTTSGDQFSFHPYDTSTGMEFSSPGGN